jgi:hypothetical protein
MIEELRASRTRGVWEAGGRRVAVERRAEVFWTPGAGVGVGADSSGTKTISWFGIQTCVNPQFDGANVRKFARVVGITSWFTLSWTPKRRQK